MAQPGSLKLSHKVKREFVKATKEYSDRDATITMLSGFFSVWFMRLLVHSLHLPHDVYPAKVFSKAYAV